MDKPLRILLVEDSLNDVTLIEDCLRKEGLSFALKTVGINEDFEKQLVEFEPDVVISDHSLPQFNSTEALEVYLTYKKEHKPTAAFILVTRTVLEEFAVKAIQSGADDYIFKDRLKRLPTAIQSAVKKNRLREQRRQAEEEKLHLLDILQTSLNEVYVFDPTTLVFQYANREALTSLGYTMEEITRMTCADIIHDFDADRFRRILAMVEKSKKGRIYERYAVRKDKTRFPVQIHLQVVEQGEQKKFLANVLDITETKEYEQQKKLALFIQNCFNENRSLEASLTLILKELCGRSSLPGAEIWTTGFDQTEIRRYGYWIDQGESPSTHGKLFAQKAFETGKPVKCDFMQTANNLSDVKMLKEGSFAGAQAYPIKSGSEIAAVIVAFSRDATMNKASFISLKEGVQDKLVSNIKRKKTEEELQKIFEFSPDILVILGQDGFVRKVNPALQKTLGYSTEEMLVRSYDDLIHPDDKHVLEEWKHANLKESEVAHYESRWLAKSGEYRWFAWSVTPFLKEGLQFGVGKDITEYKEQVKSIKGQNQKLAEIAWEQSHVVRAPLSRLMACVAYLEEEEEENEEHREEVLESIKASAHELDDIVQAIVKKTENITEDVRL